MKIGKFKLSSNQNCFAFISDFILVALCFGLLTFDSLQIYFGIVKEKKLKRLSLVCYPVNILIDYSNT